VAVAFCPMQLPDWVLWPIASLAGGLGVGLVVAFAAVRWLDIPKPLDGRGASLMLHCRRLLLTLRLYSREPALLGRATLMSLGIQVVNVLLVWLLGMAVGVEVPFAYYGILVPVVTLLVLVPMSINGMGVREAGTLLLLRPLGVSDSMALMLALLWFATYTATSLGGGLCSLFGGMPVTR